jgi:hypothetical protein
MHLMPPARKLHLGYESADGGSVLSRRVFSALAMQTIPGHQIAITAGDD